jgi:hypothetical protein
MRSLNTRSRLASLAVINNPIFNVVRLGREVCSILLSRRAAYWRFRGSFPLDSCGGNLETLTAVGLVEGHCAAEQTEHRDLFKVGWIVTFAAAAYNLVRMRKLISIPAAG